MPVLDKQNLPGRGDAAGSARSKYAREIALVLLLKLVLIVALKFAFFNDPVKKSEIVGRLDAAFSSQPAAAHAGVSSETSRKSK